jgi:hypothetical protein
MSFGAFGSGDAYVYCKRVVKTRMYTIVSVQPVRKLTAACVILIAGFGAALGSTPAPFGQSNAGQVRTCPVV